uniref:Uncharacterized protein n=1 Tax=Strongyloides papillosus TaxID=174720 RepID=A0A0N5BHG2_STREA
MDLATWEVIIRPKTQNKKAYDDVFRYLVSKIGNDSRYSSDPVIQCAINEINSYPDGEIPHEAVLRVKEKINNQMQSNGGRISRGVRTTSYRNESFDIPSVPRDNSFEFEDERIGIMEYSYDNIQQDIIDISGPILRPVRRREVQKNRIFRSRQTMVRFSAE